MKIFHIYKMLSTLRFGMDELIKKDFASLQNECLAHVAAKTQLGCAIYVLVTNWFIRNIFVKGIQTDTLGKGTI